MVDERLADLFTVNASARRVENRVNQLAVEIDVEGLMM
jgi:hypothetical protein